MKNNEERINKYNEVLLNYLNNLVKGLEPTNQLMSDWIDNITINFKKQLNEVNLDIADNGVKTLLANILNEYIKILKYHFDHSNIHKIDIGHSNNMDINDEVNQVTNNLVNAVANINKIPEYKSLIDSITNTLINYFIQTFSDKENIQETTNQIINNCIISCLNNLSASRIDEFNTNTLPTLIAIGNTIAYVKEITQEEIEAANLRVNDERDAFIYENMDVEIEEGFENGVVTLSVTDSMGNTIVYEGREAMEKLVSYNQLFEASRPGKKADISKWEHLLEKMYEEDAIARSNETMNSDTEAMPSNDSTVVPVYNFNNNLVKDIALNTSSQISSTPKSVTPVVNPVDNNETVTTNSDNNNVIIQNSQYNPVNNVNTNDNINLTSNNNFNISNEINNNNISVSEVPSNSNSSFVYIPEDDEKVSDNNDSNNLVENTFNDIITATKKAEETEEIKQDDEIQEIKSILGIKEETNVNDKEMYNSSFSFVPNFVNPNQERDDFIKKVTGSDIDEDVDNKGMLYLKVKEPTGREQIYTGKEAINMIKNYNRTYLDANPGKKVDTSLIDQFDK